MNKEQRIEGRILEIKKELMGLGEIRPGSLTRQKRGGAREYLQLSYTHRGKGHTEYVPEQRKEEVEEQLANYRRLRELTEEWVGLGIELAQLKREQRG